MSASTGAHTIWAYVWEDDGEFNQAPGDPTDDVQKAFGANETVSSQDRSNNPERMMRPFQRYAAEIIETNFDGSWGADFVLANTWWLQFLYGQPTTSGTSAPYTHTYSLDSGNPPRSAQLIEEVHHEDGTVEQSVYTGAVSAEPEISVSVQDTVGVSLSGVYADETTYDGNVESDSPFGVIGSQPDLEYRPMHFGNSVLNFDLDDDGTAETLTLIQDASISMSGNLEPGYELGTRFMVIPQYLQFEPSVDYAKLVRGDNSPDERVQMYGSSAGTGTTSPQETMDGAAVDGSLVFNANTTTDNKLTLDISGGFPESYSRSNVGDPTSALEEDVTRMVANVEAVVESDVEDPK